MDGDEPPAIFADEGVCIRNGRWFGFALAGSDLFDLVDEHNGVGRKLLQSRLGDVKAGELAYGQDAIKIASAEDAFLANEGEILREQR